MIGITSFGAYVPRGRLNRAVAAKANAWANPGLAAQARGERAMAGWDEDSLTMAVEAARHALAGRNIELGAVYFGSTTHPFTDRQNAGVVAAALDLPEAVASADFAGSLKAGTAALLAGLDRVAAGRGGEVLAVAAEHRRARAGSVQELMYGDAAAAFTLGSSGVIAEHLGSHSVSTDFVDHYRAAGQPFDYHWEERWLRDEAFQKWLPDAIRAGLAKLGIAPGAVDRFVLAEPAPKLAADVARRLGIADAAVADGLHATVGQSGAAQAPLMLAAALESAKPGQTLVVVGFGQGCDLLAFRVTPAIAQLAPRSALAASLARRKEEKDYAKFQAFNEVVTLEKGLRAEANPQTALSAMYRKRRMLLGLVGGRCRKCGTPQFPAALRCVNPGCHHAGEMDPYRFADEPARIKTWASDWLTYTPEPPAHYGMIEFERGGRFMADITDWDFGQVSVGQPVRMVFRVRGRDPQRGMIRYFWKAAPLATVKEA
ncbi:MAG: 3-oxoacyl-[acyl-carrier-protein] synthase III C-terminal domain-containing protein [Pseudomonadota bacterium]